MWGFSPSPTIDSPTGQTWQANVAWQTPTGICDRLDQSNSSEGRLIKLADRRYCSRTVVGPSGRPRRAGQTRWETSERRLISLG